MAAGLSAQTAGRRPRRTQPQKPTFSVQVDSSPTTSSSRRQGQFRSRSDEGRIRDLRGRREAGHLVDDGRHRRARDERAGAAAAAAARRASSCRRRARATTCRAASSCSSSTTCICSSTTPAACASCSRGSRRSWCTTATCSASSRAARRRSPIDMTYDKTRLDEAIKKMAGNELKPTDIINGPSGSEGPSEVRYRAHVAFSTVERAAREPGEGPQSPQGAGVRQRRVRLQSVPGRAPRPDGSELAVRAERVRARRRIR